MDGFVKLAQDNTQSTVAHGWLSCAAGNIAWYFAGVVCGCSGLSAQLRAAEWVTWCRAAAPRSMVRYSGSCAHLSIVFCWAKRRYWENWRTCSTEECRETRRESAGKKRDWRCNPISSGVSVLVKFTLYEYYKILSYVHNLVLPSQRNKTKKGKTTFYSSSLSYIYNIAGCQALLSVEKKSLCRIPDMNVIRRLSTHVCSCVILVIIVPWAHSRTWDVMSCFVIISSGDNVAFQ